LPIGKYFSITFTMIIAYHIPLPKIYKIVFRHFS